LHFVNLSISLAHVEHGVNILGTLNAALKNVKMKMVAYDAAAQGDFFGSSAVVTLVIGTCINSDDVQSNKAKIRKTLGSLKT